jgi:hypothetical protein
MVKATILLRVLQRKIDYLLNCTSQKPLRTRVFKTIPTKRQYLFELLMIWEVQSGRQSSVEVQVIISSKDCGWPLVDVEPEKRRKQHLEELSCAAALPGSGRFS